MKKVIFIVNALWIGGIEQALGNLLQQLKQEDLAVPGSGRCPREGHGTALQYSCWENPMDRGAWWATIHGITKSDN